LNCAAGARVCGGVWSLTALRDYRPAEVVGSIRSLLSAGLTVYDVADLLRAQPRAIEALIG